MIDIELQTFLKQNPSICAKLNKKVEEIYKFYSEKGMIGKEFNCGIRGKWKSISHSSYGINN